MKIFTIQKSEVTEDLKNKIFNGLSDHDITQMSVDDLKPPLAFISIDTSGILMGAIVVQPF